MKTHSRSTKVSAAKTATILALSVPMSLDTAMPMTMPSRSITAICASPFAVMSPMLSDFVENDLYLPQRKREREREGGLGQGGGSAKVCMYVFIYES